MRTPTRNGTTRLLAVLLLAATLLPSTAAPARADSSPADTPPAEGAGGGTTAPDRWEDAPYPPGSEVATNLALKGMWGEAIALYRLTLLRSHLKTGRWEDALRLLQRMEGSPALAGGLGPREIRRQAALTFEHDAAALCNGAFPAEALTLSDLAVRFDPSRPDSWTLRAFCRQRVGMAGEAEADYRKALTLDSRHFGAVLGLARLLQGLGRPREATALWDVYLSLDAGNGEAWLRRGESVLAERNPARAIRDLEQACALGNADGCRLLGETRGTAPGVGGTPGE